MEEATLMLTTKEIGARIGDQRRSLHLTQVETADKLGVPRSTFAQYETGVVDMPVTVMLHVCQTLQMSPEMLVSQGGAQDHVVPLDFEGDLVLETVHGMRGRIVLVGVHGDAGLEVALLPASAVQRAVESGCDLGLVAAA